MRNSKLPLSAHPGCCMHNTSHSLGACSPLSSYLAIASTPTLLQTIPNVGVP